MKNFNETNKNEERNQLEDVVEALKREVHNLNNDARFNDGCRFALELLMSCNV